MPADEKDDGQTAIDPVCGMRIRPENSADRFDYRGKTYFFCSASCLARFRAVPEQFLSAQQAVARAPTLITLRTALGFNPASAFANGFIFAGRIYLSDASGYCAKGAGHLSDLRHGA